MYKVLKNESDFDDWIRVLPDEVSVVSTQTAVKNSLKEYYRGLTRHMVKNAV